MDGELPADWWLEGEAAGSKAWVENGRLRAKTDQVLKQCATVWLNRPFRGDVELSFDVHVVGSLGNANNMNLFFMYQDPSGRSLYETREDRADAKYRRYHGEGIVGYIVTFLASNGNENEGRFRLRRAPPFNPPVDEFFGYEAKQGKTFHVQARRVGNRIQFFVDGVKRLDAEVEPVGDPGFGGYIGFRTFQTELWWDNVVVKQLGEATTAP